MFLKRQTRPDSEGQMSVVEDLDEFDRILVRVSMLLMTGNATQSQIGQLDRVDALFQRRAARKEFPASSFLAYLQYAVSTGNLEATNDLLLYAFSVIYPKLSWVDRTYALDLAGKMKHEALEHFMELFSLSFLRADVMALFEPKVDVAGHTHTFSPFNLLQIMTIFHMSNLTDIDIWRKCELAMMSAYRSL